MGTASPLSNVSLLPALHTDFLNNPAYTMFCCFATPHLLFGMMGVHYALLNTMLSLLGVIVFTFYIIYDTPRRIGGKHKTQFSVDDYASAAFQLYLDIINVFFI